MTGRTTAGRLPVRLYDRRIGALELTGPIRSPEDWRFQYDPDYVAMRAAEPLGVQLPLREDAYEGAIVRNWFCNLLPEGQVREAIEARLRLPPRDDIALLAAIGGECAGAVSIGAAADRAVAPGDTLDLQTLLALPAGDTGEGTWAAVAAPHRLSLAGAQDKIAIVLDPTGDMRLPARGEPSTHILKPESARLPGLRDLEALGLALARQVGLPTVAARLVEVAGRRALIVERYDREQADDGGRQRVHQEDFCQALGMPGELKYQSQGGPSLADCASLLRTTLRLGPPALQAFRDWVAYCAVIGNADAHAKNLALLRPIGARASLAPFYDLVPTITYPASMVDRTPALDIGGAPRIDAVEPEHWDRFADQTGYGRRDVRRRVAELASDIERALPGVAAGLVAAGADVARMERATAAIGENARRVAQSLQR